MSDSVKQGFPGEFSARLAALEARLAGMLGEMAQLRADAAEWQAIPEPPAAGPAPLSRPGDAAIRGIIETLIDRWQAGPAPPAVDLEATMILPGGIRPQPPQSAETDTPAPLPRADPAPFDADKTMVFSPAPPKAPPKAPPLAAPADAGEITLETVILTAPPPRPATPQPQPPQPTPPADPAPSAAPFDLAATVIIPPRKPGDPGRR